MMKSCCGNRLLGVLQNWKTLGWRLCRSHSSHKAQTLEVSRLAVLECNAGADRAERRARFLPVWRWLCSIYRHAGLPSASRSRAFRPLAPSKALVSVASFEGLAMFSGM
ncbi:unnamed protein product [Effrenium voratum]|uniref:Uncharacterized protein n=1 Tax=Effrenium voratum TaxID=2562239 RepID=A0AA36JCQ6_9DINO|nr:unnamed protein product [Effrenium voratum]CAJ1443949.1 unnamed protein product [Effrenium voratum]